MTIRDVTAAKQVQFVGIEQRFTGSLNFGAHSLNSRIDGLVVHSQQFGMQNVCGERARNAMPKK